jgi:hypothetical protein
MAAFVNGGLRLASVSYNGEYAPGYVLNGVFTTNSHLNYIELTEVIMQILILIMLTGV